MFRNPPSLSLFFVLPSYRIWCTSCSRGWTSCTRTAWFTVTWSRRTSWSPAEDRSNWLILASPASTVSRWRSPLWWVVFVHIGELSRTHPIVSYNRGTQNKHRANWWIETQKWVAGCLNWVTDTNRLGWENITRSTCRWCQIESWYSIRCIYLK